MNKICKVMVLTGEGINCEEETAQAFRKAGGEVEIKHLQELMNNPGLLEKFQVLAFPGGFSYGDELHSGQILAMNLKFSLGQELNNFIARKGLIIGICNGFQVLMKLGVFEPTQQRSMTLYHNQSFEFQNRWVRCHVPFSHCIWTQGLQALSLPVRHGEGRIIFKGDDHDQKAHYDKLMACRQIALTYTEDINGSYGKIAGLTDSTGQVLGLMPHPEAALESWLYPSDYHQDLNLPLSLFKNAIQYVQESL
jgi:phosphoribosylformylglycinamidine synthase subunit PurQ / glutaminase